MRYYLHYSELCFPLSVRQTRGYVTPMAPSPLAPNRPTPLAPATRPQVIQGCFPGNRPNVVIQPRRPGAVQPLVRGSAIQLPPGALTLRPHAVGQRLPEAVQRKMAEFFKADFSDVRVHVGNEAAAIGALAFTHGSDLYFAHGQYNPMSVHGQRLIAHELTHVVQQREGRVRNTFGSGIAIVQDPMLEREAELSGNRLSLWSSPSAPARDRPQNPRVTPPVLQRFPVEAKWGPENSYTGGSSVHAYIGADHEWIYGSKPAVNTPKVITTVDKGGGVRYIAGHLLNDNMGGEGINENLTVLSSHANKKHRGVEGIIKWLCTIASQIERFTNMKSSYGDRTKYEYGVEYKVEVLPPNPDGTATDVGEPLLAEGLRINIRPIRKDKKTGTIDDWPEMQAKKLTNSVIKNVPPYPPKKGTGTTTTTTIKKSTTATYKEDTFDWSTYDKVPQSYKTRSGRPTKRFKPY